MKKKTIFFDLDGTLLGKKDGKFFVPQSTRAALAQLKRAGHRLAACSGRQEAFIHKFFPGVFQNYVAMNGTHVVFEGKTILDLQYPAARVRELMARFDPYGCGYVFVGKRAGWARHIPAGEIGRLNENYGFPGFLETEWNPEEVRANSMDLYFHDEEEYERCRPAFSDDMVLNRHPSGLTADLSFRNQDKAKGIACFLAYGGIGRESAIAFGDGSNDITMMNAVGFGVAMGNAVEEVKRAASYVTSDFFHDGIAEAVRRLGLI